MISHFHHGNHQQELQQQLQIQQQLQLQQQQPQQQQQQEQAPERVYYITRTGRVRMEREEEPPLRMVVIDDLTLRRIILQVYISAIILIVFTCATWLLISETKVDLVKAIAVPAFVWITLAFLFLIFMSCVPRIRQLYPVNWIMSICIVLFITLAGASYMNKFPVLLLGIGLLVSGAVLAALYACGAMCPPQIMPGVLASGLVCFVLFILLLVFAVISIFSPNPIYGLVFVIIVFISILIMAPFQARYVHGRLDIAPIFDVVSCVLNIYIFFIVIFYCIFYFYHYHNYDNKED